MDEQREQGPAAAEISTAAVGVLREYTGRGPTKAKTMITDDLVTVLFADTLTKGSGGWPRPVTPSGSSSCAMTFNK